MATNNHRPLFESRFIAIAIVCAVLAVLATHHPVADAQSVDGAVSPAASQDAAGAANRRLKLDPAATATALRIVLPPPDAAESRKSEAESRGNRPLRIGFPRSMPSQFRGDLSPNIDWISLDDGSIAGTVLLTSPGALAMRVSIRAELGAEGEIRFFAPDAAEGHSGRGRESRDLPVITREDFYEGGEPEILWSPTVEGDTLGMEITLPSREALSAFSFRIEQVSHIYVSMGSLGFFLAKQLDCDNHVDVQCRAGSIPGDNQDAVGRIRYVKGGSSYACSGTLLNDSDDDTTIPYFLTANHCLSTGTVARTVEARWFYQRESCGSTQIDPRFATTYGGADLLATSVAQDSTLLRFKEELPGGLVLSAWSADPVSIPAQVYGIHHPDGGVKKYSAGHVFGQEDSRTCVDPQLDIGCFTVRNALFVRWSDGTTEGGSSGSGLFRAPEGGSSGSGLFRGSHLIGALSGGGRRLRQHKGLLRAIPRLLSTRNAMAAYRDPTATSSTPTPTPTPTPPSSTPGVS